MYFGEGVGVVCVLKMETLLWMGGGGRDGEVAGASLGMGTSGAWVRMRRRARCCAERRIVHGGWIELDLWVRRCRSREDRLGSRHGEIGVMVGCRMCRTGAGQGKAM